MNALRLMVTEVLLVAARSVTSAAKLDTLPAAVPRVVATEADSVVALVAGSRPAIRAVASVIWPVTAPKARSAMAVSWAASHSDLCFSANPIIRW